MVGKLKCQPQVICNGTTNTRGKILVKPFEPIILKKKAQVQNCISWHSEPGSTEVKVIVKPGLVISSAQWFVTGAGYL